MIADKWFREYGVAKKITFTHQEHQELSEKYPKIHKLADQELTQLPNALEKINSKSRDLEERKRSLIDIARNITSRYLEMQENNSLEAELQNNSDYVSSYLLEELEGKNLSEDLVSARANYQETLNRISNLEYELTSLNNHKDTLINNISNLKSTYKIIYNDIK